MKQGKTLQELAMELDRRADAAEDFVADTRKMQMNPVTSEITIEGVTEDNGELHSYPANDIAHGQIAYRTQIPKKYYDRMREESPALLAGNVNHWFHDDDNAKRRMVRTLDGDVRAFLSDRYRRIDNGPVADAAMNAMLEHKDQQYEVLSADVTDTRLYIQARLPRLEGEVKVGQPVQAGLIITNSEVGMGAIDVRPMIYNLICTNGMVTGSTIEQGRMRRTHVGGKVLANDDNIIYQDDTLRSMDETLMRQIRDAIHQLSDPQLFMKLMDRMKAATEGVLIEQPIEAVERLTKTLALPKLESDGILESLIRSQDYSRWGMLNAVTEQANNHASYDRAVELETIGGQILDMSPAAWKQVAVAA